MTDHDHVVIENEWRWWWYYCWVRHRDNDEVQININLLLWKNQCLASKNIRFRHFGDWMRMGTRAWRCVQCQKWCCIWCKFFELNFYHENLAIYDTQVLMLNTIFTKRNLIQICKWNKWFLYKLIIICLVLLLPKFYYLIQTFFINNFKFSSLDYAFSLFHIYREKDNQVTSSVILC